MKVFVVEDSATVRERIVRLLRNVPRFKLAGEADTAEAAVAGVARSQPEVVTLDLGLRAGNGLEVLRALKGMTPMPVVIILTINATPQCRKRCLSAGADYFFCKAADMGKVVETLTALQRRGTERGAARRMTRPRMPKGKRGGTLAPLRTFAQTAKGVLTPDKPPAKTRPRP